MSNHLLIQLLLLYLKPKSCYLDENNIIWKHIDDKFIGKRSVWTNDFRACWLEDTTLDNIKSWWCGKDANYDEIFININT